MNKFITIIGTGLVLLLLALVYSFSGSRSGFQNPDIVRVPGLAAPPAATPPAAPPAVPDVPLPSLPAPALPSEPTVVSGFQDKEKDVDGYDQASLATYPF